MPEVTKEIDINKVYRFNTEIVIKKIDNYYLVISPNNAKWLVLNDIKQVELFNELSLGKKVCELYDLYEENEDMIEAFLLLLTQIEAKEFETKPKMIDSRNLFIYLTNRCNLHCQHCYMYAGDVDIKEIDSKDWKRVLTEFKQNDGKNVTFSGGEISIRKDLSEILKFAKELQLITTILTNGVMWDEELIQSTYHFIDEVQISIDGHDEKSNSKIRGKNSFEKALKTLDNFYRLGVKTSIAVTPLLDGIDDFIIGFEKFGKQLIERYPDIFIKLNLELIKGRDVELTEEENLKYRKKLKLLNEKLYPDYFINNFVLNFYDGELMKNCGFGEITISANGDIYYCNRIFDLYPVGNIFDNKLEEVFTMADNVKVDTSVDNITPCSTCDLKYICGGGCRLEDFYLDKTTNKVLLRKPCLEEEKLELYRKMIASNEYFYQE